MSDPTTKRCSICAESKLLDEFHGETLGRNGRANRCKPCSSAYHVARRLADPEAAKVRRATQYAKADKTLAARQHRAWVKANADRAATIEAKSRAKRREQARMASAKWRAENPQRHRRNALAWIEAHPDQAAEIRDRRRARKLNAYVAPVSRRAIYERDGGKCGICHKAVLFERMHLDHIIPLSKGGTHEPRNVQVTHQLCNNRKYSTGPGQPRLLE